MPGVGLLDFEGKPVPRQTPVRDHCHHVLDHGDVLERILRHHDQVPPAVSTGERNGPGEDLAWLHPVEGLAATTVELSSDGIEVSLRVGGEIGTLGKCADHVSKGRGTKCGDLNWCGHLGVDPFMPHLDGR